MSVKKKKKKKGKTVSSFYFIFQVEMFGVTADETGQESSQLLNEFVSLQKEIFSSLKLHFRWSSNFSMYSQWSNV